MNRHEEASFHLGLQGAIGGSAACSHLCIKQRRQRVRHVGEEGDDSDRGLGRCEFAGLGSDPDGRLALIRLGLGTGEDLREEGLKRAIPTNNDSDNFRLVRPRGENMAAHHSLLATR